MDAVEVGLAKSQTRNTIRSRGPDATRAPSLRAYCGTTTTTAFDSDIFNFALEGVGHEHRSKTTSPASTRAWPVSSSTPPRSPRSCPRPTRLTYRGYPVQELAASCSFEEVAYLLWHGELPTPATGAVPRAGARRSAEMNALHDGLLRQLPTSCHPMDTLRTAVSFLGAEDPDEDDHSDTANQQGIAPCTPSCRPSSPPIMRRRHGLAPIAPRATLDFAENFLHMCFGEVPEPRWCGRFESLTRSLRRAQLQRLDVHRAGGHLHALRHLLRGHRRRSARSRARCTAAPTRPSCTILIEIGSADRRGVAGATMPWREAQDHGLRPPRLQERRLPGADHEDVARAPGRALRSGQDVARYLRRPENAMRERKGIKPNLDFPPGRPTT